MSSVPVIGIGQVSALGIGIAAAREELYHQSVLPTISDIKDSTLCLPVFMAPGAFEGELNRPTGMLMCAVREALTTAGIDLTDAMRTLKIGAVVGTTVLANLHDLQFCAKLRDNAPNLNGAPFREYVDSSPADYIHKRLGLNGPAITVSNACASSADAIGIAKLWLESHICDVVIAAGIDTLEAGPLDGFNALGVFSKKSCTPFDANRSGLNLGEAAAALVMAAPNIGTTLCSIAGYASRADANHITQPMPSGEYLEIAIRRAIEQAEISPAEIDFVNAHGTGTEANDRVEGQTLHRIFGDTLRYHSTKGLTGHTLGAAGALEAVLSIIMLQKKNAVRSCRFCELPEDIPVAPLVADTAIQGNYALSTSLAFGGANSAIVIKG